MIYVRKFLRSSFKLIDKQAVYMRAVPNLGFQQLSKRKIRAL